MSQDYAEVFSVFQKYMEEEDSLRDAIRVKVKEMEQSSREIITHLQGVHKPKGSSQIPELCEKAKNMFVTIREQHANLKELIPDDEFYRLTPAAAAAVIPIDPGKWVPVPADLLKTGYHEHWRFVTQRLVFSVAFIVFLESGKLLTREEAAEYLGISANSDDNFHIVLEDFLLGLLMLADELSRLSVNCATNGDYKRPVQIAEFVSELNVGFRLLNLKNDTLRKRFDGLKYCLKKVEEIVYDLSIRGLKCAEEEQASDSKNA